MPDRHEEHDLALVVAYVDGEVSSDERATAEALVESCAACAMLVADLRTLAEADRTLAVPARPRDFQLTTADAERLTGLGPEPVVVGARLSRDMTNPDQHRTHDPMVIAAAADGGLDGPERARAEAWLSDCPACADLHADLVAIAAANRAMPTPPRPRDFRLTTEDARRATGTGWRGVLARIGSARDGLSRPLAFGLTAIGLAGLLLSSGGALMPGLSAGGAASAPEAKGLDGTEASSAVDGPNVFTGQGDIQASAAASAAPLAASSAGPAAAAPAASAAPLPDGGGAIEMAGTPSGASDAFVAPSAAPGDTGLRNAAPAPGPAGIQDEAATAASGTPAALIVSLLLLAMGLGLFVLRWIGRRRTAA